MTQQGGEIPRRIDRYEIIAPIGFGAMGAVYKAFDPIIKRPVAVKTIRFDVPPASSDYRAFLERFKLEARTAGRLSHPNIVTLYDVGHTEDQIPWLAMEFVDGQTVAELLQGERLKPEVVIGLVSQIASALDYAHSEGVVHRDIKPSNVIVYAGEKVKVTDFGIAKLMDAEVTQSGLMMGTPSYMSPEQAMGEDLDGSTDLFSLGVVAFEMLSGLQPFPGNNVTSILYKLVHADPIQPDNLEVLGLLPDKWHEVFSRALAKSPGERYPSAAAFVQHLELCLGSWFGALEGETLIVREPLVPVSSPLRPVPSSPAGTDSNETVMVKAEDLLLQEGADRTLAISGDVDTRTAEIPASFFEPPPSAETGPVEPVEPVEMDGTDVTIGTPVPAVERTLYTGPGIEATSASPRDGTLAVTETKPAMTVSIRKPGPLKPLLVPLGAGAIVLAGLFAFLLGRGGDTLPAEPAPPASEPPVTVAARGSLVVATQPEGARVLVNGEERGVTPLALEALPLGAYQIRLEQAGYQPEELAAELTESAPRAALDISLRPEPKPAPPPPRQAFFRIQSSPPGAEVAVDGRSVGTTPLERVRVEPGERVVQVLREGFLPWEDTILARAGRTEPIEAVLTERPPRPPVSEPVEETEPSPLSVTVGSLVERDEAGVVNPKCISCPAVRYPDAARRNRMEGVVELGFLIDENGGVQDLEILESGGDVFDEAVVETVRGWRYEPATKHGVRVKMRWVQRFRFQQGR